MYYSQLFDLTGSPFLCQAIYNNKNQNDSGVISSSYAPANRDAIKDDCHSLQQVFPNINSKNKYYLICSLALYL